MWRSEYYWGTSRYSNRFYEWIHQRISGICHTWTNARYDGAHTPRTGEWTAQRVTHTTTTVSRCGRAASAHYHLGGETSERERKEKCGGCGANDGTEPRYLLSSLMLQLLSICVRSNQLPVCAQRIPTTCRPSPLITQCVWCVRTEVEWFDGLLVFALLFGRRCRDATPFLSVSPLRLHRWVARAHITGVCGPRLGCLLERTVETRRFSIGYSAARATNWTFWRHPENFIADCRPLHTQTHCWVNATRTVCPIRFSFYCMALTSAAAAPSRFWIHKIRFSRTCSFAKRNMRVRMVTITYVLIVYKWTKLWGRDAKTSRLFWYASKFQPWNNHSDKLCWIFFGLNIGFEKQRSRKH